MFASRFIVIAQGVMTRGRSLRSFARKSNALRMKRNLIS
jgi:hypothetical protein